MTSLFECDFFHVRATPTIRVQNNAPKGAFDFHSKTKQMIPIASIFVFSLLSVSISFQEHSQSRCTQELKSS